MKWLLYLNILLLYGIFFEWVVMFPPPMVVFSYYYHLPKPPVPLKTQIASYYDYDLPGEALYSRRYFTAASRDFPRGTKLNVCRIKNKRCVVVRVNDYIEHPKRNIDLSSAAFQELGSLSLGLIEVTIEKK